MLAQWEQQLRGGQREQVGLVKQYAVLPNKGLTHRFSTTLFVAIMAWICLDMALDLSHCSEAARGLRIRLVLPMWVAATLWFPALHRVNSACPADSHSVRACRPHVLFLHPPVCAADRVLLGGADSGAPRAASQADRSDCDDLKRATGELVGCAEGTCDLAVVLQALCHASVSRWHRSLQAAFA